MSAKPRLPAIRSVKTPEALAALRAWLATLDEPTRERGETYFADQQVEDVWADADHYVEAIVTGEESYAVTLFFTRGKWTSKCSCPVGVNCKHVYAAGLAWLANVEAGGIDGVDPAIAAGTVGPTALPEAKPRERAKDKLSFRDEWAPVIAEKLGRSLTDGERNQLVSLAALFAESIQGSGWLYPAQLRQHGFEVSAESGRTFHTPVFTDWWDPKDPPSDPWALWQYIACDYERTGRPIPEVFRPLTDTRPVRAAINERLVQQELAAWRRAFAGDETADAARHENAAALAGLRVRISPDGALLVELRLAADKPWRSPAPKWFAALANSRPADFERLPPAEAALAIVLAAECRSYSWPYSPKLTLTNAGAAALFGTAAARGALVLPDEQPFTIESEPLVPEAVADAAHLDRLDLHLIAPDGRPADDAKLIVARPEPLYLFDGRVWHGPPPLPARQISAAALADAGLMSHLRAAGLRLPASLEVRRVALRPVLKCWSVADPRVGVAEAFHVQLLAHADHPPCEQQWGGDGGWHWVKGAAPPARNADEPLLEFDLAAANATGARFADFRLAWDRWTRSWTRTMGKHFPDEVIAWRATLPADLTLELSPELAGLFEAPLLGHVEFSTAQAPGEGRDWFDLTVQLRVEDTTFKPDELALLLKARGKWVRLAKHGWRRLELAHMAGDATSAALDRLGLRTEDVLATGRPTRHRLHTLQLAGEAETFAARDAAMAAALRDRAAAIAALPAPPLPAGLLATLRHYQEEGFHFLAHLAANGFGGILADDMGLGKTVQALTWLLYQAGARSHERGRVEVPPPPFRALVVCPKSVMHGWQTETVRFTPTLAAIAFEPAHAAASVPPGPANRPTILVANYAQLRIHATWFQQHTWDAVILDEAQFIKNPLSQTAAIARSIPAAHRLALTGTPIENRLLDLWSLFAFVQPGLLGQQAAFRRQFPAEDPTSANRLRRRVRHFMLRRTKAQVAPELPPRTEDEILVDLEGGQRLLYDAELKRARAQLLGVDTARALDAVRFNVLASLLRLRQICCHPGLIDAVHRDLPSAKLDALLERLEELRDEGMQVLVFSQFVELLLLIKERLEAAGIVHLLLTGQTENRAELVDKFQADRNQTVFLLSLKAAGFGLNLTAASYVILCDPWWNPAVEAQAIDRTHRIGQTQPVVAYRLVAADTVEQKIRALQEEKAALAAAVVQEESLASVLDLDSLRRILA
jgi:superfamily II DNA or RNA helicase